MAYQKSQILLMFFSLLIKTCNCGLCIASSLTFYLSCLISLVIEQLQVHFQMQKMSQNRPKVNHDKFGKDTSTDQKIGFVVPMHQHFIKRPFFHN